MAQRWTLGGICVQPLFRPAFGLPDRTRMPNSCRLAKARREPREPELAGPREGIGMIFARWRARRASRAVIEQILGEIVAAARRPALYQALQAPDLIDGRFELLTLHAGLVLRRLKTLGSVADAMAQEL